MDINDTLSYIKRQAKLTPSIGVLLRESLNVEDLPISEKIDHEFSKIPHFKDSTITGRHLRLIIGKLENEIPVALLTGRLHYYEGFSMSDITLPFITLMKLGVKTFIITNASGLLSERGEIGDVMVIRDHINLMGVSPLRGVTTDDTSELHTVMIDAYTPELRRIAGEVLDEVSVPHFEGVYVAVSGPTYETRAEVDALRILGGDAVGMSTVPEVQAIVREGGRVLGLSIITNNAGCETRDDEVNLLVGGVNKTLLTVIIEIIKRIGESDLI